MYTRPLAATLSLAAFASCAPADGAHRPDETDTVVDRRVTFIQYNDFHANLVPHRDLVRDPDAAGGFRIVERGGAARIKTVFDRIREDDPQAVALNVGDTFHGGVEALYTDGEAVADVVAAMQFDVGVPGNWDFGYGPGVSWKRYRGEDAMPDLMARQAAHVRTVGFVNLAANAVVDADETSSLPAIAARQLSSALEPWDGDPWLPPTHQMTVNGVNVGFIGLTSDIVERMHPMMALGIAFELDEGRTREMVERHAAALREDGAQVVVVLSELGIQKDLKLADTIDPGTVDVFFSGHTHEVTTQPLQSDSGALVVEAGNDGYVGELTFALLDSGASEATWTLYPVDASIEPDEDVAELVRSARAPFVGDDVYVEPGGDGFFPGPLAGRPLTRSIETVIGQTDRLLHRRDSLESSFNNAYTDWLVHYAEDAEGGVDGAMSPGFRYEVPLAPAGWDVGNGVTATGDVTLEEAYRYFPAPYTIGVGTTTLGDARQIHEDLYSYVFSPDIWRQNGGWVDGFSGFEIGLDLAAADGARITDISMTDGRSHDGAALRLAGCRRPMDEDGVLCSHEGFSDVHDLVNPESGLPLSPIELMEWGLSRGVPEPRQSHRDTSGEPMWPVAEYVQPLRGVKE